ncbi:DUF4190 domain-containing protein [Leifsonia sp. NPDC058230]|uniref:DUF4190 domain-containing protein n=1 Tax=Leifsonia sp. NPDC058230 TaxID=3346391 RepID=UPI0036DE9DA3
MSTPDQPQQPDVPQQPQYTQPPAAPQYGESAQYAPAQRGYNTLAIVGFILSFFVNVVGVILSFVALSQIKRTGEQGRGLAIAGIIIGFAEIAFGIIFTIIFVALLGAASTYQISN